MNEYGKKFNVDTLTDINGGSFPVTWDTFYFVAPWGDSRVDGVTSFEINGLTQVWQNKNPTINTFYPRPVFGYLGNGVPHQIHATGVYNLNLMNLDTGGTLAWSFKGDGSCIIQGLQYRLDYGEQYLQNIILLNYEVDVAQSRPVASFKNVFSLNSTILSGFYSSNAVKNNILKNTVLTLARTTNTVGVNTNYYKDSIIVNTDFTTPTTLAIPKNVDSVYSSNSFDNDLDVSFISSNVDSSVGSPEFNSELLNDYTVRIDTAHWRQGSSNKNIGSAKLGVNSYTTYAQTIDAGITPNTWNSITI